MYLLTATPSTLAKPNNNFMQQDTSILQSILEGANVSRKKLLPTWIKVFAWFFMLAGILTPFILIAAIALPQGNIQLAIYGFETNVAWSATGLFIVALFMLKGIVSFGLLNEKQWAISFAIADAVLGIIICTFSMFIMPFIQDGGFSVRLELALLIPYLLKLLKIKPFWISNYAYNH